MVVEVLHKENLSIAAEKALIFIEREHDDTSDPVTLNPDRVKHGFIGVESELARDLLGRDRQ